jgi:hypothetical protein
VALQRRLVSDDQCGNPYNPCLAVFTTGTSHVLPFDPCFGADTARLYASKYAAKLEQHYYLETQKDSVKDFLKCRAIGVCIAHSRLLGFHVVRSTRPCTQAVTIFVQERQYCRPREDSHIAKWPLYPHPTLYVNRSQQYFFRHAQLRHLRLEQVIR